MDGPFLKSLLNVLQYCFCLMFWAFAPEACRVLAPKPGIKPIPPALEDRILITWSPGKSLKQMLQNYWFYIFTSEAFGFVRESVNQ